ncbi:MAG: IPT/TIG domain-containing protein [Actinobacteria bacterium]|nr:IPT/TIG domain-containing protein [Actinomycetota bacterium]
MSGFGPLGWTVIGVVILLIVAGVVLLVTLVLSSMTSTTEGDAPARDFRSCAADTWFDAGSGTCVPRAVCRADEEYVATSNSCTAIPMAIDSIEPSSGLVTGGTEVRVTGARFEPGATVLVDGVPAVDVTVVDATTITATTPGSSNLYPVDIEVTASDGSTAILPNAFTYLAIPVERITEIVPTEGSVLGGEAVIIKGADFADGIIVTFGGRGATNVTVLNPTTLRATTPLGKLGPVSVSVRDPDGNPYSVEDAFTYVDQAPRVVMLVRPVLGAQSGGTAVTIAGTGFAEGATVSIDGKPATKVVVVSDTKITAITPPGELGLVTVAVRNPGLPAALLDEAFEYVEAPTITGVVPADGPESGGSPVKITGTGFLSGATVTFDGADATAVKIVNDTTITAKTPAGTAGPATVVVTNPEQPPATAKKAFTYVVVAEPKPSGKPSGSALPACMNFRLPDVTGATGGALDFGVSALFPSSMAITDPVLGGASFSGDSGGAADGSITWQASPPRIVWQAGPGKSSGTIQFTYTASSCAGVGAGNLSVFAN